MPKMVKLDKIPENIHNWTVVVTMIFIALLFIIFSSIVADPRQSANAPALTATAESSAESALMGKNATVIPGAPLHTSLRTNGSGTEPTVTSVPERLAYLDPEYFENSTETNGIIIGGTVIALIILISVLILLILERIRDSQFHAK